MRRLVVLLAAATGCDSLYSASSPGTGAAHGPIEYVQNASRVSSTTSLTISASFTNPVTEGDMLVVTVGWNDGNDIATVSDTTGAKFVIAQGPDREENLSQAMYYAIVPRTTAFETIAVTMLASTNGLDLRAVEYSGVDPDHPIDAQGSNIGFGAALDSGGVTTVRADDLLVAGATVESMITMPGDGFQQRVSSAGNIIEDLPAPLAATYSATATQDGDHRWVIHAIALAPAAQ